MEIWISTLRDVRKYWEFIVNSIRTEIQTEAANSYIGYFWWILDPLLYMFIYIFVVTMLLGRRPPDYSVFLFSGLLFWRWTSSSLSRCTNSIISKKNLLAHIYIPKFVLPLIRTIIETIYFLFSIIVLLALLTLNNIPFTWHYIELAPLVLVQFLFNFGIGLWLSHFGAYYYDLDRVLSFILRAWYYISPGLYSVASVPVNYQNIFWLNPMAVIMESGRNVFMYGTSPIYVGLLVIFVISLIFIHFGLRKLRKFDQVYAKVI